MKHFFVFAAFLFTFCGNENSQDHILNVNQSQFPIHPEISMTTGELCKDPRVKRYPKPINYCERSVDSDVKKQIIADYDKRFGYRISSLPREDFKIDHYIPLCMGGSNSVVNLWPQHKSVYSQTDKIEEALCKKMAAGKMDQAEAVAKMTRVKFHLEEAAALSKSLQ